MRQPLSLPGMLAALAALAIIPAGCSKAPQKQAAGGDNSIPVITAPVELVTLDKTLAVVGTLFPMDEAIVAAQVEGLLEQTRVDFGSRVTNGQELALIDTASYEALAQQASANVERAKANSLNAQQNLKRIKELQASKISPASELEAATAQAEQALAEVRAAEAALKIATLNLERSRVKAPFNGTISERTANAGDYVKVGTAMFKMVNDTELKYTVQAPERYAGQIKPGHAVQFSVDAYPGKVFQGEVYLINPSVNTASRSFSVAARVQNGDRTLKANSFARGNLLLEKDVPTPVVPLEAVLNFSGINKVFVVEGANAKAREVRLGRVQQNRQEILEGVKPGELVAVSGVTKLYDNAPVRKVQETNPGVSKTDRNGT